MSATIIGVIYLIQPVELIGTNRYKIGMSAHNNLKRCSSYKKGSRYLCIFECINPVNLENIIKYEFNKQFKLIAGKEYFEGNEYDIKKLFIQLFTTYDNIEPDNNCIDINIDNVVKNIINILIYEYGDNNILSYIEDDLSDSESRVDLDYVLHIFKIYIYIFSTINFNFNYYKSGIVKLCSFSKINNNIICNILETDINKTECKKCPIEYKEFIYIFLNIIYEIYLKIENKTLHILINYINKHKHIFINDHVKCKIMNVLLKNFKYLYSKKNINNI